MLEAEPAFAQEGKTTVNRTFETCQAEQPARRPVLTLLSQYEKPVITVNSPGAEGIKYGFEGGRAVKIGKTYHLITTENVGDPRFTKTRFGYWTSADRLHWKRVSTIFASSGDQSGKDPLAVPAGGAPVYNEKDGRWEFFYTGYRSMPETDPQQPHKTYQFGGTIWRAVSKTKGMDGIGGPYENVGIVLAPGPESEPWEGFMGTDSFFPYRVKDRWYGFYGSCHTEKLPIKAWQVGLASAPDLAGPWKRLPKLNPVPIEEIFIENPVVTRFDDGTYVAVYNSPVPNAIGYTLSNDGIHWSRGIRLDIQPKGAGHWANAVRTPLGLIPEGNNTFTLFYTGCVGDAFGDPFTMSVGLATLKLGK